MTFFTPDSPPADSPQRTGRPINACIFFLKIKQVKKNLKYKNRIKPFHHTMLAPSANTLRISVPYKGKKNIN
jgi:hypothetical protein